MAEETTITVVTFEKGTFDINGIAPIGTVRKIPISKFSAAWMRPKTKADEKKIEVYVTNLSAKGAE